MITINWTQLKRNTVCDKLEEWIKKYDAYLGEHIMQDDNCQIYAPVLLSEIVDEIIKPERSDNE